MKRPIILSRRNRSLYYHGESRVKTDLYYFTGTGNTLWIAKQIAEHLDNTELHSIPNVINHDGGITGENIGVVCPIYMYDIPHIVVDFIGKIKRADHLFIIFAGAGKLGGGLKRAYRLFDSHGLTLSSLFNVEMPSNYTPFGVYSETRQRALFAYADKRVKEISKMVSARDQFIDYSNTSFFKTHVFPGILYRMGYRRIPLMDNSFYVENTCTGCGICEQVCPVNNITMRDNKPSWKNRCQQCYACLQWCPSESIQYGKRTKGVGRYHHPEIAVKEIIDASADFQ